MTAPSAEFIRGGRTVRGRLLVQVQARLASRPEVGNACLDQHRAHLDDDEAREGEARSMLEQATSGTDLVLSLWVAQEPRQRPCSATTMSMMAQASWNVNPTTRACAKNKSARCR